jgi:hypothetical protein
LYYLENVLDTQNFCVVAIGDFNISHLAENVVHLQTVNNLLFKAERKSVL